MVAPALRHGNRRVAAITPRRAALAAEDTSALSFYGVAEIMCVIDAHTRATAAAKTMNPDEGIRGNRIVFNPLNEGERIRGIWQICIPKFSTLGLTSRETSLSGCHPMLLYSLHK